MLNSYRPPSTGAVHHTVVDRDGPVRCAAVDTQFKHVVTAGDDKMLKIRAIDGLDLVNERYVLPYPQ